METKNNSYNLELLKFVSEMGEKEQDRLWHALGHMLTLNGGLFVLLGLSRSGGVHNIHLQIIAILGVIVCVGGALVIRRAKHDASRWQADAVFIIEQDELLKEHIKARTSPRSGPPPKPRASEIIRIIFGLLAVFYVVIFFLKQN